MADFDDSAGRYDEDRGGYERRDRSASPRGDRDERNRSRSPNGRDGPPPPASDTRMKDAGDDDSANTGTNLFVTGIHPRLTEADVTRLFEKYGEVENCSIMLDPHTKESRGFGFVKMVMPEQADAAREGLQGEVIEGRTLSIEKARRARPRTPTPGKYFGPPKRGDFRGGSRGGYRDRYDDRRGGYGGRRDDYRGGSRYDDRGYGGRRDREDYGSRNIDRYEGRRDEGYGGGRGDRRGGYHDRNYDRNYDRGYERNYDRGYERNYDRNEDRSYGGAPPREEGPRESYGGGGREYNREDRYGGR